VNAPPPTEARGRLARDVLVLLNRGSRRLADGDGDTLASVRAGLERRGLRATVRVVGGGEMAAAARAALDSHGVVVAGGGDGSIACVAAVLAGSDVALGVLPLGTLNHFARDLGLGDGLDAALDAIAAGHVRAVDVAEVNGRVFVNNSSLGVYPRVVAERDRTRRERGWSKGLALAVAGAHALRHYRHRRLVIAVDGRASPRITPLVFVGNNGYVLEYPEMGARPRLDGGELCLYVVRGSGAWKLVRLLARAVLGTVERDRDLERIDGVASVTVAAPEPRVQVALDGEVVELESPLVYRIRPLALRVLAPRVPP
jgi:diacylglycerol kinase family enzyme